MRRPRILCHVNVASTQESYTMRGAVDPQPPSGRCRSSKSDCATKMQLEPLNVRAVFSQDVQSKAVILDGEMAEWLKAAVC